ncbi:MAG: putative molybdenum carrier protein [Magnetococcales bacterium]|nr:putative molybdenum carrier protein [Magnetococcales bacterium]MBF0150266.1 putative molybdenum carrier protein [Magnetococcales bacterium]MBF0172152.1 putative molybdenum carrier protein [Magnetococcales bacterium]MBF0630548.1 putative molybdenum carrier protein [Magnetococcales bacterium]
MVVKIVSGGQTGVDRAALDFAMAKGIEAGGWCPKGRRAEDGTIPQEYPLMETHREDYPYRTILNVIDSDGTLILFTGRLRGGSALTLRCAQKHQVPCMSVDLRQEYRLEEVKQWIERNGIEILNVAGPRESENRGIHDAAMQFFMQLWS